MVSPATVGTISSALGGVGSLAFNAAFWLLVVGGLVAGGGGGYRRYRR
jgi:hypothetical protein